MKRVLASLLSLTLHGTPYASGMVDAEHAMRSGNYAEAYCVLRPLAEQGEAEAQYNIGWMYHNGYGLAVNDSLALEWWRRASEQGHIDASFSIATLYNHGAGEVARDRSKALEYFLRAAESGHDDAVLILRSMLIRDDVSIREQRAAIIEDYGYLFGQLKQVKARLANIRSSASLEADIVTRLEKASTVIVLDTRAKWSQIAIAGTGQVAWVYSSLLEEIPLEGQQDEQAVVEQAIAPAVPAAASEAVTPVQASTSEAPQPRQPQMWQPQSRQPQPMQPQYRQPQPMQPQPIPPQQWPPR